MPDTGMELCGVGVRYGRATALDNIDLTVPPGNVTALVGPNGAGKSSTILAAYGSIHATGTVYLDGKNVSKRNALQRGRSGVGLVPQGRQVFPKLTVRENLKVMAGLLHLKKQSVDEAIDRFPALRERAGQLAGVLSGGEQQMLVVSRALMSSPSVLLLDETMTGLAPKIVAGLVETVRSLADEGVAVLIADPQPGQLLKAVDRGYVLLRGGVVAQADDPQALDRAYRTAMGIVHEEIQDAPGTPNPQNDTVTTHKEEATDAAR